MFTDDGALPGDRDARLRGARRLRPRRPTAGETGARLLRPAAGHRLHRHRAPGARRRAVAVRRRPVRPRHRRAAALPRHGAGGRRRDGLDRGRGLGKRLGDGARRARPRRCSDPAAQLARQARRARGWPPIDRLDLPGDRARCRTPSSGASRTSPTSRRPPTDLEDPLRRPGQAVPAPLGHRAARRRSSAPASPTTRGCSPPTASTPRSPRVALGQFEADQGAPARAARRLGRAQRPLRQGRARGRRRRLGLVRRLANTNPDGSVATTSTPTSRSSSRARSRWSGAGPATTASATRCYDFSRRNLRYVARPPRRRQATAGPRASATSSARAWARRSSTTPSTTSAASTTSPTWPAPSATRRTERWATGLADGLRRASTRRGGRARRSSTRTRCEPGNARSPAAALDRRRRRWRPSCRRRATRARPGAVRARDRGARRRARTTASAASARSTAASSTPAAAAGRRRRARATSSRSTPRSRRSARATTAGSARANSSATPTHWPRRCSPSRRPAGRPTSSRARCRRSSRRPDHGAAEHRPLLDLPLDVHAGLGPLRHRLAGRPPAARRAARPGPRPARGRAAGAAGPDRGCRDAGHPARWRVRRRAAPPRRGHLPHRDRHHEGVRADEVVIGHTLPSGARPTAVVLDGRRVHNYQVLESNRGTEVTVRTTSGPHTLTVTT